MFFSSQKNLWAVLRAMQLKACAYRSAELCDCKFVRNQADTTNLFGPTENSNGCPELRTALAIIESMTDGEYRLFCDRASRLMRKRAKKRSKAQCFVMLGHDELRCQKTEGHRGRHECVGPTGNRYLWEEKRS